MISFPALQSHFFLFVAIQHLKLQALFMRMKRRRAFIQTYTILTLYRARIRAQLDKLNFLQGESKALYAKSKRTNIIGGTNWIRAQIDLSKLVNNSKYFLPRVQIWHDLETLENTFYQKGIYVKDALEVNKFTRAINYGSHQSRVFSLNNIFLKKNFIYDDESFFDIDEWSSPGLDSAYGFLNPIFCGHKKKDVVFGDFDKRGHTFVEGEFAYIFGRYSNNYWHFIYEYLPKLLMLSQNSVVIIPADLNYRHEIFLKNYLELLGLNFIKLDDHKIYKFSRIHVPGSPIVRQNEFEYSFDLDLLKKHKEIIREIIGIDQLQNFASNRIILLTRNSPRRVIIDKELKNLAEVNSILILDPSVISIKKQAAIFNSAKAVLSYPGAVWANLVFAPPTLRVFNIAGPGLEQATLHQVIAKIEECDFLEIQLQYSNLLPVKSPEYSSMDKDGLRISRAEAITITNFISNQ